MVGRDAEPRHCRPIANTRHDPERDMRAVAKAIALKCSKKSNSVMTRASSLSPAKSPLSFGNSGGHPTGSHINVKVTVPREQNSRWNRFSSRKSKIVVTSLLRWASSIPDGEGFMSLWRNFHNKRRFKSLSSHENESFFARGQPKSFQV